jgi:hypothetical protein
MYKRGYSVITLEDFKNQEQTGITYTSGEPSVGQWTYDDTIKGVKVNANRGYFRVHLGKCAIGDIINVKAEVFNISGVKFHTSVDYHLSGSMVGTSYLVHTQKIGDWEIVDVDFHVFKENDDTSIVLGLSSGEVGQYLLKNVTIIVDSAIAESPILYGGSGNSRWIKYPDGMMITYQKVDLGTIDVNLPWGNVFNSGIKTVPNFPASFISVPAVSYSWTNAGYSLLLCIQGPHTTTKAANVEFTRGTAQTGVPNVVVDIIAIGRWK